MRHPLVLPAFAIVCLLAGCGDPKGAAGAIGAPAAGQDPSKMDKKAPSDVKLLKATPTTPIAEDKQAPRAGDGSVRPVGGDAAQKVTPVAPVESKIDVEAKIAPQ